MTEVRDFYKKAPDRSLSMEENYARVMITANSVLYLAATLISKSQVPHMSVADGLFAGIADDMFGEMEKRLNKISYDISSFSELRKMRNKLAHSFFFLPNSRSSFLARYYPVSGTKEDMDDSKLFDLCEELYKKCDLELKNLCTEKAKCGIINV